MKLVLSDIGHKADFTDSHFTECHKHLDANNDNLISLEEMRNLIKNVGGI